MNEMNVPFMIWGNPISNAGYNAIFHFNNPTFTPPGDSSPQGMADNDFFFTVNISQAFTNIVLVQNHVTSADSSRGGRLKFAMSVPKGYKLAGGTTPYEVLTEMRNLFVTQYMDPVRGDGAFRYKFRMAMPAPQALEAVLAKYRYVPVNMPHRIMSGQTDGFLRVPSGKMHDLFSDLQYPEFQPYRQIVIAEKGDLNPHIGISGIPRPINWHLRVNNAPRNWPKPRPDGTIVIADPTKNPRYWENAEVSFRPADAAAGTVAGVIPDYANEIINVRLNPMPRQRVYNIEIHGGAPSEIRNITIIAGHRELRPEGNRIILKGEDIDIKPGVKYNGFDYSLEGSGINGDTLIVNLRKKPRLQTRQNAPDPTATSASTTPIPLTVIIACGKESRKYQDAKIIVEACAGSGRIHYSEHPVFYADNSRGEAITATINVPGYFQGRQAEVRMRASKGKAVARYTINNDSQPIEFRPESIEKAPVFGNISSLLTIILTLCALLIGCVAGWFGKGLADGDKDKNAPTETVGEGATSDGKWYEDQAKWEDIENRLEDRNLDFATVDKIYKDVKAVKDNPELGSITGQHESVIRMVENYVEVINAIKSGERPDQIASKKGMLNKVHGDMLLAINEGWIDETGIKHEYTAEARDKAKEQFARESPGYSGFLQIYDIHNGKQEFKKQSEVRESNPASRREQTQAPRQNRRQNNADSQNNNNQQQDNPRNKFSIPG